MEPPLLEFSNVYVSHDGQLGLKGLNLTVHAREHVAILGPNGSGKSTLIKTITRDCYPLALPGSKVRIFGRDTWNIFDLRPLLGIVHNDLLASFLRYPYSGREVILSGFFSSVGIWPNHQVTPDMGERAEEILEQLGLTHLADRMVNQMSTGEGRRLLIARALVHRPKAIILDEPTASLDIGATHALLDLLRQLAATTTIILVTHHLSDIIPEVNRVVLLKDGRVHCDGDKRQVLSSDTLSQLFDRPVELLHRNHYYYLLT
ncbi:MAG: ATP-binding cassette domain-containing protein [Bryobacteraceae bacterium]|nr:ATP-binding cassette domain-containing protein [Bryobacteraceae bacterium]MDW8378066.1 ATP-binding cassette domain-containing protein [Bryobacterales bacterium]